MVLYPGADDVIKVLLFGREGHFESIINSG